MAEEIRSAIKDITSAPLADFNRSQIFMKSDLRKWHNKYMIPFLFYDILWGVVNESCNKLGRKGEKASSI